MKCPSEWRRPTTATAIWRRAERSIPCRARLGFGGGGELGRLGEMAFAAHRAGIGHGGAEAGEGEVVGLLISAAGFRAGDGRARRLAPDRDEIIVALRLRPGPRLRNRLHHGEILPQVC